MTIVTFNDRQIELRFSSGKTVIITDSSPCLSHTRVNIDINDLEVGVNRSYPDRNFIYLGEKINPEFLIAK